VGNEENEYLLPGPNTTMINITKELSDIHKNSLKEEILKGITKNPMERLLDMANQN
jgi:hypothetical protein